MRGTRAWAPKTYCQQAVDRGRRGEPTPPASAWLGTARRILIVLALSTATGQSIVAGTAESTLVSNAGQPNGGTLSSWILYRSIFQAKASASCTDPATALANGGGTELPICRAPCHLAT